MGLGGEIKDVKFGSKIKEDWLWIWLFRFIVYYYLRVVFVGKEGCKK